METLNNIISNLSSIASTMGYTGPTIDAITYLAANSIYMNEINAITAILEASPTRCKLINSAIQHAKDVGHSVNRGTNQHIIIKRIKAVESKSYKKFDQAAKIGNYYLYFANDINVTSGTEYSIEFIVGKEVINETIEVVEDSDLLRLRSKEVDYSSDIEFYNELGDPLAFTEIKREIFELESGVNYWITTTTDYGLEVYIFPNYMIEGEGQVISLLNDKVAQFNAGSSFILKGVRYLNDTIDINAIKTIPGFRLEFEKDKINEVFESIDREDRSENTTKIYRDSLKSMDSSFMIRASHDIENTIMSVNNNIKACKVIITPPSTEDNNQIPGKIYVYYLTKDLTDEYGISDSEKNEIMKKLKKSYYVNHEFLFEVAKGHRVVDEDAPEGRKYKLYLTVHYNTSVNAGDIEAYINEYNYSIGTSFDPNKVIGGLVRQFPGITYVHLQKLINGGGLQSDTDSVNLKTNEFIDFELKVNYESIR